MSLEVSAFCNDIAFTEDIGDRIGAFPDEIKQVVDDILHRGAQRIAERARQLAPVKTGNLRRQIVVAQTPDGWSVDSNAYYSYWVEVGHQTRGKTFVPGVQFLQNAIEEVMPQINMEIDREINNYLQYGLGVGRSE